MKDDNERTQMLVRTDKGLKRIAKARAKSLGLTLSKYVRTLIKADNAITTPTYKGEGNAANANG